MNSIISLNINASPYVIHDKQPPDKSSKQPPIMLLQSHQNYKQPQQQYTTTTTTTNTSQLSSKNCLSSVYPQHHQFNIQYNGNKASNYNHYMLPSQIPFQSLSSSQQSSWNNNSFRNSQLFPPIVLPNQQNIALGNNNTYSNDKNFFRQQLSVVGQSNAMKSPIIMPSNEFMYRSNFADDDEDDDDDDDEEEEDEENEDDNDNDDDIAEELEEEEEVVGQQQDYQRVNDCSNRKLILLNDYEANDHNNNNNNKNNNNKYRQMIYYETVFDFSDINSDQLINELVNEHFTKREIQQKKKRKKQDFMRGKGLFEGNVRLQQKSSRSPRKKKMINIESSDDFPQLPGFTQNLSKGDTENRSKTSTQATQTLQLRSISSNPEDFMEQDSHTVVDGDVDGGEDVDYDEQRDQVNEIKGKKQIQQQQQQPKLKKLKKNQSVSSSFRQNAKLKRRGASCDTNGFKSSKASRKIIYEELDENQNLVHRIVDKKKHNKTSIRKAIIQFQKIKQIDGGGGEGEGVGIGQEGGVGGGLGFSDSEALLQDAKLPKWESRDHKDDTNTNNDNCTAQLNSYSYEKLWISPKKQYESLIQQNNINKPILSFKMLLNNINQRNYEPSDYQFYDEQQLKNFASQHYGKQIDCPPHLNIREYVDHSISKELNEMIKNFISILKKFYYNKTIQLAKSNKKARKRLITGIRQVARALDMKSASAVICAPDIQKIPGSKGIDSQLKKVFKICREKQIPVIFGLSKRKLAGILGQPARQVSMVAIDNHQGADAMFKNIIQEVKKSRQQFYSAHAHEKEKFIKNDFIDLDNFELYGKLSSSSSSNRYIK